MFCRRKVLTVILAFLFCFLWSIPPAAAHPSINVVYLASSAEVPWGNLQANTVYFFPNESSALRTSGNLNTGVVSNQTRDTHIPNNTWDVVNDGRYTFAGSATSSNDITLYTLYNFTGRTTYTIYVSNLRSNDQVVNCHRINFNTIIHTFTVPGNTSMVTSVHTSYTRWYLGFPAKCNVEGYVE